MTTNLLAALLAAIATVESANNPQAVGDRGRAHGIYQIHAAVVHDVNRLTGSHYRWPQDARNPTTARRIAIAYLAHHAGPHATPEQTARIWNGGPRGHRKHATLIYWRRIERELARQVRRRIKQG